MEKVNPCCAKEFDCTFNNILLCQYTQIHLSPEVLAYIDKLYPKCFCLKDLKDNFYKQGLDTN